MWYWSVILGHTQGSVVVFVQSSCCEINLIRHCKREVCSPLLCVHFPGNSSYFRRQSSKGIHPFLVLGIPSQQLVDNQQQQRIAVQPPPGDGGWWEQGARVWDRKWEV